MIGSGGISETGGMGTDVLSSEFWVLSSGLEADKKSGTGERGTEVLGSEF